LGILSRRVALNLCGIYSILKRIVRTSISGGAIPATRPDRRVTKAAVEWLGHRRADGNPWTAYVSLVAPHFPLIAPQEFYDRYADLDLMPTKPVPENEHPWLQAFRDCYIYDNFTEEKTRIALASYYALTTFMDDNVGQVLNALDAAGLAEDTVVLYLSDHGDNAGERGLWGKSVMYEESVGIPMVLAGPGVPEGKVSTTPATLTDVYATALDVAGLACDAPSLREIASSDDDPESVGFSEYHAAGSPSAAYMIRKGRWKYVHYVDYPPQLFDMEDDPDELFDLGLSEKHSDIRAELAACLMDICDPNDIDRRAKADQRQKVDSHGGREAVVEKGSFGATPIPAT
jgi:choline-sulfatase